MRSLWRLAAWPVVLLLAAACTAGQTAFGHLVSSLRPRSGLPNGLRDHVEASRDVFIEALRPEHQLWSVYAVAVAVGLLGSAVLWRRHGPGPLSPATSARPVATSAAAATPADSASAVRADARAR